MNTPILVEAEELDMAKFQEWRKRWEDDVAITGVCEDRPDIEANQPQISALSSPVIVSFSFLRERNANLGACEPVSL